jgi:hypothetical protein
MPSFTFKRSQAAMLTRPKTGRERRRAERKPMQSHAELYRCPSSSRATPLKVAVKDVSATGVGVVHDEPLPVGQKYVVKEPLISQQKSVLYTVVRAERMGADKYSIGLHASHLIDEGNGGFIHSGESASAGRVNGMAKLLLLAMLFGGLAAAWTLR